MHADETAEAVTSTIHRAHQLHEAPNQAGTLDPSSVTYGMLAQLALPHGISTNIAGQRGSACVTPGWGRKNRVVTSLAFYTVGLGRKTRVVTPLALLEHRFMRDETFGDCSKRAY